MSAARKPRWSRWRWWLAAALLLAGSAFYWLLPDHAWNQKLTLVVEADGREYRGSAVSRVTFEEMLIDQSGRGYATTLKGEAAFVKIGDRGVLFALLNHAGDHDYSFNLAGNVLFDRPGRVWTDEAFARIAASRGRQLDIPRRFYPLLVTFADIADPKTVRRIDPDDLAASFGEGVAIKSITLEITNESVTEGRVESVLGWLEAVGRKQANLKGKPVTGLVSNQPDPQIYMIAPSDFSTELYK